MLYRWILNMTVNVRTITNCFQGLRKASTASGELKAALAVTLYEYLPTRIKATYSSDVSKNFQYSARCFRSKKLNNPKFVFVSYYT